MSEEANEIINKLQVYMITNPGTSFMEAMDYYRIDECNRYDKDGDVLEIMESMEEFYNDIKSEEN